MSFENNPISVGLGKLFEVSLSCSDRKRRFI